MLTDNTRTKFALYECSEDPSTCPILLFLALAFDDDAFEAISTVQQLFDLKIPDHLTSLTIDFKDEVKEQPVFKRIGLKSNNESEVPHAFQYKQLEGAINKLGLISGFKQNLTSYHLRRGAANAINSK